MSEFSDTVFHKYADYVWGVHFSKHFFERLESRHLEYQFGNIIKWLDDNVCLFIYEMTLEGVDEKVYNFGQYRIPIVISYTPHARLIVKTIFYTEFI